MNKRKIVRYVVIDEDGVECGNFSCDGLAYEWMDSLQADNPESTFKIEERVVEEV